MKRILAAAGAAAVVLAVAPPASAATRATDTYKVNAAYTEWSTLPSQRAALVPGQTYTDTYLSAFHATSTYRTKTRDRIGMSYFEVTLRATKKHHLRLVSFTTGHARNADVAFEADRLQSLTASASMRTRTCYRKPRECVRGDRIDASATWTGHGRHYVSGMHFVSHSPGFPTTLDNERYTTRDATVDATPSGPGPIVDSQIYQAQGRFSG